MDALDAKKVDSIPILVLSCKSPLFLRWRKKCQAHFLQFCYDFWDDVLRPRRPRRGARQITMPEIRQLPRAISSALMPSRLAANARLRRRARSSGSLGRLLSFSRRICRRLLQTFRIGLQPFDVRRALRLDRRLVVRLGTTGRREQAKNENENQKVFHGVDAIGVANGEAGQIATPRQETQQSKTKTPHEISVRRSSNSNVTGDYRGA